MHPNSLKIVQSGHTGSHSKLEIGLYFDTRTLEQNSSLSKSRGGGTRLGKQKNDDDDGRKRGREGESRA